MVAIADGEAMDWCVLDGDAFDIGVDDLFDAESLWLCDTLVSSTTVPVILTMTVNDAAIKTDNSGVGG